MSDLTLELVHRDQLEAVVDGMLRVYAAAFAAPPYNHRPEGAARFKDVLMARHAPLEGFRCLVARVGGSIVAFTYGTTTRPGNWWHDAISPALGHEARDRWLRDAFALAELAVEPGRQGQGIGSALHDAVLAGVSHETAVAQVRADARALRFYERHGWHKLISGFLHRGSRHPVVIIGLALGCAPQANSLLVDSDADRARQGVGDVD
ncbi:MAG: GNAT family N-acetyltransferase [Actinomycetota bacterium]|nr:GNAT family N-acetyltransferase [Actinomycetota bacterium]